MLRQDLASIIQGIDLGLEELALIKAKPKRKLLTPPLLSPPLPKEFSFIRYDPYIWISPKKSLIVEPGFHTPWVLFPAIEEKEAGEFVRVYRQRAKTERLFSEEGRFYYSHVPNLVRAFIGENIGLIEGDDKSIYDLFVDKVADGKVKIQKSKEIGFFESQGKTYLERVAEKSLTLKLKELIKRRSNFKDDLERHLLPLKLSGFGFGFLGKHPEFSDEWYKEQMTEYEEYFKVNNPGDSLVDDGGFDWSSGESVEL
jgi:hypothetical protein